MKNNLIILLMFLILLVSFFSSTTYTGEFTRSLMSGERYVGTGGTYQKDTSYTDLHYDLRAQRSRSRGDRLRFISDNFDQIFEGDKADPDGDGKPFTSRDCWFMQRVIAREDGHYRTRIPQSVLFNTPQTFDEKYSHLDLDGNGVLTPYDGTIYCETLRGVGDSTAVKSTIAGRYNCVASQEGRTVCINGILHRCEAYKTDDIFRRHFSYVKVPKPHIQARCVLATEGAYYETRVVSSRMPLSWA